MNTQNKTILVTGASSGIGLGIVQHFFQQGWNVVLNARNEKKLKSVAESLGGPDRVVFAPGDIGQKEVSATMVAVAVDRFGAVDVLVNNAGIFAVKPFLEFDGNDLDAFYHTNLKGTFLSTQAAVRQMQKQGSGSIINIGYAGAVHTSRTAPSSAPNAMKAAIHSLAASLGPELAAHNIRINTVAPMIVRTPMHGEGQGAGLESMHPLNRIGEVADIVAAVDYLAAAEFTTGIVLPVDGGYVAGR